MVHKLSLPALEPLSSSQRKSIPNIKQLVRTYNENRNFVKLPLNQEIIGDIADFIARNQLADNTGSHGRASQVDFCCMQCCKAYALTRAHERRASAADFEVLSVILEGVCGHYGYYLDEGNLCKVPEKVQKFSDGDKE